MVQPEAFALFKQLLDQHFGLIFPESRRTILEARLRERMRELQLSNLMDYYHAVRADGDAELMHLATLATNNETYFFREKYQFESLFHVGLESLKASLAVPGSLRILCAGCSSGEEAFTLSFYAIDECGSSGELKPRIQAFDIDQARISSARRGIYRPRSLREMTDDQIERYLIPAENDNRRVKPGYHHLVSFDRANIVDVGSFRDFSLYDVVFCRNVLIYFSEAALRQAIENFATVLRPGGLLFLGPSESIIGMSHHFETVRLGDGIVYRRVEP